MPKSPIAPLGGHDDGNSVPFPLMNRRLPTPAEFFRLAVAFEGGLILAGLALGWLMSPPVWEQAIWNAQGILLGILWSLPLLATLVFLRQCRGGAIGRLNLTVDELLVPLFSELQLWQFAVISALAGVGEELLFRGILQRLLTGSLGETGAIAVTSIAFGLAHLITPLYGVLAALVSAYLGWLFVQYENLAVPIVTHAFYDFVALAYLVRTNNNDFGSVEPPTGSNQDAM